MNKTIQIISVTVLSFAVYFIIDKMYFRSIRASLDQAIHQIGVSHSIAYLIVGVPIVLGALYLHGHKGLLGSLGLHGHFVQAMIFGLICTLPMFVGYSLLYGYNKDFSLNDFLISVVAAAFFEELYFRGFLFGQLFRYTSLGYLPAVFLGAVLFGVIHLYQGKELEELMGIFMITFLGGILYAWVYVEWDYNLWVPIALHAFMNLSWGIFSAGENALGGGYANLFRVITIALIIILTIVYKRRTDQHLHIDRRTLWSKPDTSASS